MVLHHPPYVWVSAKEPKLILSVWFRSSGDCPSTSDFECPAVIELDGIAILIPSLVRSELNLCPNRHMIKCRRKTWIKKKKPRIMREKLRIPGKDCFEEGNHDERNLRFRQCPSTNGKSPKDYRSRPAARDVLVNDLQRVRDHRN